MHDNLEIMFESVVFFTDSEGTATNYYGIAMNLHISNISNNQGSFDDNCFKNIINGTVDNIGVSLLNGNC